jgi:hypothetical protein
LKFYQVKNKDELADNHPQGGTAISKLEKLEILSSKE